MLCKVVPFGDKYVIEHITDRYFSIGETSIGDELRYSWYPIVHSIEGDVGQAICDGVIVYIHDYDSLKLSKLIRPDDVTIGTSVDVDRKRLKELYDEKLGLLDRVKVIDIYSVLLSLTNALTNTELSSAEKRVVVDGHLDFFEVSGQLKGIEDEITKLKSKHE